MIDPIKWAVDHSRITLLTLAFLLIAGGLAYRDIPKEAAPDISIPVGYVLLSLEGISPKDSERMLVKPMEQAVRDLEGLERLESSAHQGGGSVVAHFESSIDIDQALDDMREKVDDTISNLPDDTKRPKVMEVNLSLAPVMVLSLSGEVTERALLQYALQMQDQIESLEEVLEVNLRGNRDEVIEIIVDPLLIQSYDIELNKVISTIRNFNVIVAVGDIDTGSGRFSIELPSLLEDSKSILDLPLVVKGDRTIRVRDIATVRRGFRDYVTHARINGQKTLTLEVVKRTGRNIINTTEKVRAIIDEARKILPEQIRIDIRQDNSDGIRGMLNDLQNNIVTAVILMVVVLVATLGLRGGILVSASIPASFVCGILFLFIGGFTVSMVVLFALILSIGLLTDAAVVVAEYADRRVAEGMPVDKAYIQAAKRMSRPIITSNLTTLLAFFPLLLWPGTVGEFMFFLPTTLIAVLSSSLVVALIFLPALGSHFNRIVRMLLVAIATGGGFLAGTKIWTLLQPDNTLPGILSGAVLALALGALVYHLTRKIMVSPTTDHHVPGQTPPEPSWLQKIYGHLLQIVLHFPKATLGVAVLVFGLAYTAYIQFGHGIQFFPFVEPEQLNVEVYARGNLSIEEQDQLVQRVEQRLIAINDQKGDFDSIYTTSGQVESKSSSGSGLIGVIRLKLLDEMLRRKSADIRAEIVEATANISGVVIQVELPAAGPPIEKAIQVQLFSDNTALLENSFFRLRDVFARINGLVDIEDSGPKPGIDWVYNVDPLKIEQYQTSLSVVGSVLKMATSGMNISSIRPDNTDEEVDIVARLPATDRTLELLSSLRINTPVGLVPLNNFVNRAYRPSSDIITRENGVRVMEIGADVAPDLLADDLVKLIQQAVTELDFDPGLRIVYKGQEEEQNKAQDFLTRAFITATIGILLIMLIQFNSFMQALLVLSAVVMSTIGVLLAHLIIGKPFSIIMSGIGVIALAGIVVNNNIILIDTFNLIKRDTTDLKAALIRTGTERLRPVLLTSFTTALGLVPSAFQIQVDVINRVTSLGGASGQWWHQLSSSIFYGLLFSACLTLLLTPALIYLTERRKPHWQHG